MRTRAILLIILGAAISGGVAVAAPGDPRPVAVLVAALLWFATLTTTSSKAAAPVTSALPPPVPTPQRAAGPIPAMPVAPRSVTSRPVTPPPPTVQVPPAAPAISATSALQRLREIVASDLAVHGLAYLGVLLVFAGTFGFLLVSFSRVSPSVRPLAEVMLPVVLLGGAAFLRRRGAPVVATSLGILGGILLPVVIATSLVDGIGFPAEVHGRALAVVLTVVMLALAAGYRLYVMWHPEASLRYLVAPMLWAAAWSAGLLLGGDGSIDLRHWSAAQMALVTLVVAATAVWARLRPSGPLAAPTRIASVPGLVCAYGLAVGFAAVEGWPAGAIVVAGVGAVVALGALADDAGPLVRVAQLLVVVATGAALEPTRGIGATLVVLALGALAGAIEARRTGELGRFLASVAAVVASATVLGGVAAWGEAVAGPNAIALASAVAGVAIGVGAGSVIYRAWASAASLAWSAWLAGVAFGMTPDAQAVAFSAIGFAVALLARSYRRHGPAWEQVAGVAFAVELAAVGTAVPDRTACIVAISGLIAAVVVLGSDLRRPVMTWTAWAASAALAMLLAERAGVTPRRLPIVAFAWGTIASVGAFALDDAIAGRRPRGSGVRTMWLVPPACLGPLAVAAALVALAATASGATELAVWALVGAAVFLAIAIQLRAGGVTVLSWALLTFAAAELSPWDPKTTTWLFVPWVAGLLGAAWVLRPRDGAVDPWLRWDLPAITVAHVVAAVALVPAAVAGQIPLTWSLLAVVVLAGAAVWREPLYVGLAWGLLIGAAWAMGPGWLAAALAATAILAGAASVRTTGSTRLVLLGVAVASSAGAWIELAVWRDWPVVSEAVRTAGFSAAVALAAAVSVRWTRADRGLAAAGAGLAAVAAMGSLSLTSTVGPVAPGDVVASCVAIIAAGWAVALAIVARPLSWPPARPLAAGLLVTAGASTWIAWSIPDPLATGIFAVVGVAATTVAAVAWRVRPRHAWADPLLVLIGGATILAAVGASQALPDRTPTEAVLVLAGIELAALGIGLGRRWLVAAAPAPLTAAWLLYASETLAGQVQAFTIPIGIAILVVVVVGRTSLPKDPATATIPFELQVLEFAGMAFVVSGGLVEALATSPVRGVGALAAGIAIAVWGALTRVRRRLVFGLCAATLAALELPAAAVIPALRSATAPALWIGLVVTGVVLLALATGMERGRTRVRGAIGRFERLWEGWE